MRAGTHVVIAQHPLAQVLQLGHRGWLACLDSRLACYCMNQIIQTIRHGGTAVHRLFGQFTDDALHIAAIQISGHTAYGKAVLAKAVDGKACLTDVHDLRLHSGGFLAGQLYNYRREKLLLRHIGLRTQLVKQNTFMRGMLVDENQAVLVLSNDVRLEAFADYTHTGIQRLQDLRLILDLRCADRRHNNHRFIFRLRRRRMHGRCRFCDRLCHSRTNWFLRFLLQYARRGQITRCTARTLCLWRDGHEEIL